MMIYYDIYYLSSEGRCCQTISLDHEIQIGDLDKIERELAKKDQFNYAYIMHWRKNTDRD